MSENKIYGTHIMGIPINPPYQDGILVRNRMGYPPRVRTKDGGTEPYGEWEKKHFKGPIGRPLKYTSEEQRKEARRGYARTKALKEKNKNKLMMEDE